MNSPHFFIIGIQKCGTSSVANLLTKSKDIFMPKRRELYYYDCDDPIVHCIHQLAPEDSLLANWKDGFTGSEAKYKNIFLKDAQSEKICGEASTSYFISRLAFERISNINPRPKIIICLRNPVERAWSAYSHFLQHNRTSHSFQAHLRYDSLLTLEIGNYCKYISQWQSVFHNDIHFIDFDDLKADPFGVANNCLSFLGAERLDTKQPLASHEKNPSFRPLSVSMQKLINYGLINIGSRALRKTLFGLSKINVRLFKKKNNKIGIRDKQVLVNYYMDKNKEIDKLTGLKLSAKWFDE